MMRSKKQSMLKGFSSGGWTKRPKPDRSAPAAVSCAAGKCSSGLVLPGSSASVPRGVSLEMLQSSSDLNFDPPTIENIPEASYDLSISLRLIRNHILDRSQRECEKRIAAAMQCRLYGGRMDEFAYSHNDRRVGKRGQQVLQQQIFQCPDGSFKHTIRVHGEVHANAGVPIACHNLILHTFDFNICAVTNFASIANAGPAARLRCPLHCVIESSR